MTEVADEWRVVGRCIEGQAFIIDGVNIWDHDWTRARSSIVVYDPYFSGNYRHELYKIQLPGRVIEFGALDTSANVWAFSASTANP